MKLIPMGERVLVELVKQKERTSEGGLVLPGDDRASMVREGFITRVPSAHAQVLALKSRIVFAKTAGIPVGGGSHVILEIKDILGVYEGG